MINELEEVQWAYLLEPTFQIENSAGKPLTDGWIEVYIHGTRTKYYCASDFNGTLHPFKIALDSLGSNIVLASPAHSYDIYMYNKYGSLVMSRYNVVPATGDGTIVKDVVSISSDDNSVSISSTDQTNWDLSIQDTVDRVEQNEQDISNIKEDIEDIQDDITGLDDRVTDIEDTLPNKKDKQSSLEFTGSATKTIKKITQNANGEMNVEFEDIDLPQEVPNVNVTSSDNSVAVTATIDPSTNTKTFDLSVTSDTEVEYGRFIASNVTATATLTKTRGNLELSNNKIQLKKGSLYHFTVRGSYEVTTLSNTLQQLSFIEYSTFNSIIVNVDNSISNTQFFEFSYDVVANNDIAYPVTFNVPNDSTVKTLEIDIHSVVASSSSSSPSTDATMEMCESMSYLSCSVFNQFPWTVNGSYYTGAYNAIQTNSDLKLIEGTSTITAYKEYNTFDHFQAVIYKWNPTNSNYELVAYTDRYDAPNLPNGFVHLPITHVISDTIEAGEMYYVGLLVKSNTQVPLLGGTLPSMTWANPVPQFTKSGSVYDDEANAIPASTLNTSYAETDKTESVFVQIHSAGVSYHV